MGLFSKNTCAFCGKELGFLSTALSAYKLADGQYLCSGCYGEKCSSLVSYNWIVTRNKAQILEHMEEMKAKKNRIENEFDVTDVITDYKKTSKILASFDRNRRIWTSSDYSYRKELFSIDDISRIEVDIHYNYNETKIIPRKDYIPPRPDMPKPDRDGYMNGMTLNVYIENHPYSVIAPVKLDICRESPDLFQTYEAYYNAVYTHGAKCLELLESLMK